ncbi:hypothetical protein FOZ60_010073 [Perkinsus olseni]|uniref:RING-CH-type domain-containing protein n=1 Tax=Perkinsus olseni TaxID=32597 RepID=A0A7J6NH66_PEROL|nr:hypothetical protein FOZ60_010073 [Perkinsus olseni]
MQPSIDSPRVVVFFVLMDNAVTKHSVSTEHTAGNQRGSRGTAARATGDSSGIDESTELICRICFGFTETKGNELIAPCMCKGTQKWVHVSCLQSWQRAMQIIGGDIASEKATTCNVCQGKLALAPPERPYLDRLWMPLKGILFTWLAAISAVVLHLSLIVLVFACSCWLIDVLN